MQNFCFDDFDYLVILGHEDGTFDCFACKSENEVYKVVSDRILEEIDWVTNEVGFDQSDEIQSYAEMIRTQGIIKNPAILKDCYATFFSDSWWFSVIDSSGDELFGYHC